MKVLTFGMYACVSLGSFSGVSSPYFFKCLSTLPGPQLYAARALSISPLYFFSIAPRYSRPTRRFSSSLSSLTGLMPYPGSRMVPGINWATPLAPLLLTALCLPRLSAWTSASNNPAGTKSPLAYPSTSPPSSNATIPPPAYSPISPAGIAINPPAADITVG